MSTKNVSLYLGLSWHQILEYRKQMKEKSAKDFQDGKGFYVLMSADTYTIIFKVVDKTVLRDDIIPTVTLSVLKGEEVLGSGRYVRSGVQFNSHSEESICGVYRFYDKETNTVYNVTVDIPNDTM